MRVSWMFAAFSLGLVSLAGVACRDRGDEEVPGIAELIDALAGRRPVEPRLTGGFAHAPCELIAEAGRLLPRAVCSPLPPPGTLEIAKISSRLQRGASRVANGKELHAGGIAYLVVSSRGRKTATVAVEALKAAAAQDPGNARILSDLAAAYFVRAHERDEPVDLVRALDVAAKAHNAAPDLPEARFNLALILERLHLRRLATSAWQEYREVDLDSGWAVEARGRLEHLRRPSAPERWRPALPELERAALRGDMTLARKLVEIDPQSAREHAIEERLGSWGDRYLADPAGAGTDLRVAAMIGQALLAINGDPTVKAAVEAVEKARPESLSHLASGHRAFRAAMKAYRPLRTGEASVRFAAAHDALKKGGSPVELWALCGLARCWGYEGRYGEAEHAYQEILHQADRRGFSSLVGWTQWGLGWVVARQGPSGRDSQPHARSGSRLPEGARGRESRSCPLPGRRKPPPPRSTGSWLAVPVSGA